MIEIKLTVTGTGGLHGGTFELEQNETLGGDNPSYYPEKFREGAQAMVDTLVATLGRMYPDHE